MPKCANAVPQAERGKPAARRSAAAERHAKDHGALGDIDERTGHDEHRKPDAERRQHRAACWSANAAAIATAASSAAASSRCAAPRRSPRFHASSGPNGIVSKSGTNSGPKVALKNGGADRDLLAGQGFERERIERADENRGAGRRSETDC